MLDDYDLDRFPKRKNPRLREYDYSQQNSYFITVCTHDRKCIFGTPQRLSSAGENAHNAIASISAHFPDVDVDKFVVMPNHIHAILTVSRAGTNISAVVGQFKAAVTKQVHALFPNLEVWQTSFHDHVIRNQADYARIWEYIDTNPLKWQEDCFYCGDSE